MIIEGINPITEALNSQATVEKIIAEKGNFSERINRLIALAKSKGVRVVFEEKERLDKLSSDKRHQGAIAYITEFKYCELADILNTAKEKDGAGLILLLDGIEDPHNLGAIIRVAEAAAVDGIIIPKHRSVSVTDTVVKVSAGASSHINIAKVTNLNDAIRTIKDNDFTVLAADMNGASVYKTNLTNDTALIIGGEGAGVHSLTLKLADGVISLPQLGKVNSLNASVATGIILYEAVRQRLK